MRLAFEVEMKSSIKLKEALFVVLAVACTTACSRQSTVFTKSWDPHTAEAYLDQREVTWSTWRAAARDHGTFCISCHTVLPYALARPALRQVLAEPLPSSNERNVLENVTKRVRLWNEIGPYYEDEGSYKPAESRGTEAVLNALILATYDAQIGRLSSVTEMALQNMWALQQKDGERKGAWSWLKFGMEPWEAQDSAYYGAALAAIAIGTAPDNYKSRQDIGERLNGLRDYLSRNYTNQSTINRVVLLWASTKLPDLIDTERKNSIIRQVEEKQQNDGGWELAELAFPKTWSVRLILRKRLRADWTRQESVSDGYATGLITFVLQEAGLSLNDPSVSGGLAWLARSQNDEGSWSSSSLNVRRKLSSNTGRFMSDAATAYAVLALSTNAMHRSDALQHRIAASNPKHSGTD